MFNFVIIILKKQFYFAFPCLARRREYILTLILLALLCLFNILLQTIQLIFIKKVEFFIKLYVIINNISFIKQPIFNLLLSIILSKQNGKIIIQMHIFINSTLFIILLQHTKLLIFLNLTNLKYILRLRLMSNRHIIFIQNIEIFIRGIFCRRSLEKILFENFLKFLFFNRL